MSESRPVRSSSGGSLGKWALGCGAVVLACAVMLAAGAGYGYYLWRGTPAGWRNAQRQVNNTPVDQRRRLASDLENRVSSNLSFSEERERAYRREAGGSASHQQAGPHQQQPQSAQTPRGSSSSVASPTVHTVMLPADQINAWLDQRLPRWVANQNLQFFKVLSNFRFWIEGGQPVLACRIRHGRVNNTISVRFGLRLRPDGKARLRILSVRAGRASIPTDRLIGWITSGLHNAQQSQSFKRVAAVVRGRPFEPVYPIGDRRQVRLVGVKVADHHVKLEFRSETASRSAPPRSAKGAAGEP